MPASGLQLKKITLKGGGKTAVSRRAKSQDTLLSLFVLCGLILLAAMTGAFLFNALMPQGIGFLPAEIKSPLWRPASLSKAKALWDQGALFVDARDPGQYKQGHIRGAVNLPPEEYQLFYPLLAEQVKAAKQIVVYGKSFSRFPAATVAQRLRKQGLSQVWVMQSRLSKWETAGHPMRVPLRRRAG
jgi:rhodanese-related sulfurtransferase